MSLKLTINIFTKTAVNMGYIYGQIINNIYGIYEYVYGSLLTETGIFTDIYGCVYGTRLYIYGFYPLLKG